MSAEKNAILSFRWATRASRVGGCEKALQRRRIKPRSQSGLLPRASLPRLRSSGRVHPPASKAEARLRVTTSVFVMMNTGDGPTRLVRHGQSCDIVAYPAVRRPRGTQPTLQGSPGGTRE